MSSSEEDTAFRESISIETPSTDNPSQDNLPTEAGFSPNLSEDSKSPSNDEAGEAQAAAPTPEVQESSEDKYRNAAFEKLSRRACRETLMDYLNSGDVPEPLNPVYRDFVDHDGVHVLDRCPKDKLKVILDSPPDPSEIGSFLVFKYAYSLYFGDE